MVFYKKKNFISFYPNFKLFFNLQAPSNKIKSLYNIILIKQIIFHIINKNIQILPFNPFTHNLNLGHHQRACNLIKKIKKKYIYFNTKILFCLTKPIFCTVLKS